MRSRLSICKLSCMLKKIICLHKMGILVIFLLEMFVGGLCDNSTHSLGLRNFQVALRQVWKATSNEEKIKYIRRKEKIHKKENCYWKKEYNMWNYIENWWNILPSLAAFPHVFKGFQCSFHNHIKIWENSAGCDYAACMGSPQKAQNEPCLWI